MRECGYLDKSSLIRTYCIHQVAVHIVIGIIYTVIKTTPRKVATLHTAGTGFYLCRHGKGCIGRISVHQRRIGIEVVISSTTGQCFIGRWHLLVSRRGLVSIEAGCIDFCGTRTFYRIGCYVAEIATALYKNVAIRFYHTAALARECTVARSIGTLFR